MFCNFSLKLNMANYRHLFNVLGPEIEGKLNKQKTKFALTCSFQKVIWMLASTGREEFDNSFHFTILEIV